MAKEQLKTFREGLRLNRAAGVVWRGVADTGVISALRHAAECWGGRQRVGERGREREKKEFGTWESSDRDL